LQTILVQPQDGVAADRTRKKWHKKVVVPTGKKTECGGSNSGVLERGRLN